MQLFLNRLMQELLAHIQRLVQTEAFNLAIASMKANNKGANQPPHIHRLICCLNRGIKHDFPYINIHKVPTEVLRTKPEVFNIPEGPCKC